MANVRYRDDVTEERVAHGAAGRAGFEISRSPRPGEPRQSAGHR